MQFYATDSSGNKYLIDGATSQEEADKVFMDSRNQGTTDVAKSTPSTPPTQFNVQAPDGKTYSVSAHNQEEAQNVINDWHAEQVKNSVNKDPNRELVSSIPSLGTAAKVTAQGIPFIGNKIADTPEMAQYKEDHPNISGTANFVGAATPSVLAALATGGSSVPVQMGAQALANGGSAYLNAISSKEPQNVGLNTAVGTATGLAGPVVGKGLSLLGNQAANGISRTTSAGLGTVANQVAQYLSGHSLDPITAALAGSSAKQVINPVLKNVVNPVLQGAAKLQLPSIYGNTVTQQTLNALQPQ